MSDWLDLVRAANPVPRPQAYDAHDRQRIMAAILADDAVERGPTQDAALEPASLGRRRRLGGGRPLAVILALCVAGGTSAAAVGGLFEAPAAVHAPAAPSVVASVAATGSVLALAAGLNDRARANARVFGVPRANPGS